jgi:hypothetical protein
MSFNARKILKKFVNSEPTYILTSNVSSANEGESVTFILTTTNIVNGTSVPFTITGVSTSDIGGTALTGNFVINNNSGSVTFNITADILTESTEYLIMTSGGKSVTVTINDTSLTSTIQTMSLSSSNFVVLGEEYLLGLSRPTTTYPIIPRTSLYEDLWKIKAIKIKSNPIDPIFNKLIITDADSGYIFFKTYFDSNVEIWIYANQSSLGYSNTDYLFADHPYPPHSWVILLYNKSNEHIHYFVNRGVFVEGNKLKNKVFPFSGWEKYKTDPLTQEPILDENGNEIYTPANFEFEIEYNTTYVSPYIVDGVSLLNLRYPVYNASTITYDYFPITEKPTAFYRHKYNAISSVWWLAAERRVYRSTDYGKTWPAHPNGPSAIGLTKYISTGINVGYNRPSKIVGLYATTNYLYAFTNNGICRAALNNLTIGSDSSVWTFHNSGIEVIAFYNVFPNEYPSFMTSDGRPATISYIQNPGVNETLFIGYYGETVSPSVYRGEQTISMTPDLFLTDKGYVSRNRETQTQNAFYSVDLPYVDSYEPMTKGFIVSNEQYSYDNAICYVGNQMDSNAYFKSNLLYNINTSISIGYDVKYGAGYFDKSFPEPPTGATFIFLPDKNQIDPEQSRKIGYTSPSSGKLLREELQLPVSDNWILFHKVK